MYYVGLFKHHLNFKSVLGDLHLKRIMHNILPNYPTSKIFLDHSEVMLKFASILYLLLEIHATLYHALWKNVPKFWVYHSCGVIFSPHSACRCGMVNCISVVLYSTNPILVWIFRETITVWGISLQWILDRCTNWLKGFCITKFQYLPDSYF